MPNSATPMDCSMPGLPVHHQLLKFTQTHFHWVGDAIQPSHPLGSHSPPACLQSFPASGSFPMSQLFASGGQTIGVSASASVLPMNTQDWSLGWTGWISLRVFSNTTVQKHQFFSAQLSIVQLSHPHMTTGNTIALTRRRPLRNVGDLGCDPRASSWRTYLRQSGQSARPLPGENASLSASPQTCTHNHMPICPLFQQPHENSISADSLSFPFSRALHNLNWNKF